MKKHILMCMAVSMLTNIAVACGICGCPASGTYLGILPQYQKHFIGMRYQYRSFDTKHPPSLIPGLSGRKSTEVFQNFELTGRYVPGKRIQIIAVIPYQSMYQRSETGNKYRQGFGDASVFGYYSLISPKSGNKSRSRHLLQMGTGIKIPAGINTWNKETEDYNPAFQLGTGSTDAIVSSIYTFRLNNFGIMADVSYQFNGKNKYDYRFGNRINSGIKYFYTLKQNTMTWMFHSGLYAENAGRDKLNGRSQAYTGGNLLMPLVGIDIFTRRFSAGINYRQPAYQSISEGYVKSNGRLLLSVSILIQ